MVADDSQCEAVIGVVRRVDTAQSEIHRLRRSTSSPMGNFDGTIWLSIASRYRVQRTIDLTSSLQAPNSVKQLDGGVVGHHATGCCGRDPSGDGQTNYIISIPQLRLDTIQIFLKTPGFQCGRYFILSFGQWLCLLSCCALLINANITASGSLLTSGRTFDNASDRCEQ